MLGHHPIFGSSKTQFRGAPGILVVLWCAVVGWHFIFDSARPQDAAGLGGEKSPSWHDGIQMAFHCGPYSQPPRQLTSHQMPRSLVAAPALSFRSCNRLHGRIEPFIAIHVSSATELWVTAIRPSDGRHDGEVSTTPLGAGVRSLLVQLSNLPPGRNPGPSPGYQLNCVH